MEPIPKAAKLLPTLALILSVAPAVPVLILLALSLNGNWAFLILAFITYVVSQLLCGIASLTLSIVCITKKWGLGRSITAAVLSSVGLLITLVMIGSFWRRGV